MTTDFPTAPPAYGLYGPSAPVTVEKSTHASHTEILTPPLDGFDSLNRLGHIEGFGFWGFGFCRTLTAFQSLLTFNVIHITHNFDEAHTFLLFVRYLASSSALCA
jgi:hypothetical protein